MDETDRKILDILRENARMSFSEIGSSVGISRVSVKKRMTAMEEAGIIRGYRAVINEEQVRKGIRKIGWHILLSDLKAEKGSGDGTEKENARGT